MALDNKQVAIKLSSSYISHEGLIHLSLNAFIATSLMPAPYGVPLRPSLSCMRASSPQTGLFLIRGCKYAFIFRATRLSPEEDFLFHLKIKRPSVQLAINTYILRVFPGEVIKCYTRP